MTWPRGVRRRAGARRRRAVDRQQHRPSRRHRARLRAPLRHGRQSAIPVRVRALAPAERAAFDW